MYAQEFKGPLWMSQRPKLLAPEDRATTLTARNTHHPVGSALHFVAMSRSSLAAP